MNYNFRDIEAKWQKYWAENQTFKAHNDSDKAKILCIGYVSLSVRSWFARGAPTRVILPVIFMPVTKDIKVLMYCIPMGYDSFGLPAEQYAIQTGQHPAITTETNIKRYREQLDQLGFSFDWSREVRTSNPNYYKWTQWVFIQLFNSWYNKSADKAEDISTLISIFEKEGNGKVEAVCDDDTSKFTAEDWTSFSDKTKQEILLKYRLTYLADAEVNWCPALGTVLANDEVVNGVSERGGHPVIRKKMTQWMMRITAYAQRLLDGLDTIDWPQPLKDSQTNWIGRSEGASVTFNVIKGENVNVSRKGEKSKIEVFTTRPDTIFGVSFMTLAPEHELVGKITTPAQKAEVDAYVEATAKRSERDRMADVKTISGVFTGAYAEHPFTKEPIPIWIGDYVLASYGTGAVMAVPCGDQRDYDFAKHFNIPIPNIFEGVDISEEAFADKATTIIGNSDFLNGLSYKDATTKVIQELEKIGQGEGKINYRLRDAVFSRQRYWGEPFPVYYVDGMPQMIADEHLPLELPEVEKYLPTETGEPPLGNALVWAWDTEQCTVVNNQLINDKTVFPLELNTMPGWAGSSQYFNRYMDPHNSKAIYSQEAIDYWQDVDLYIGGSEHATGHLLYSRFWQKFLFDMGIAPKEEFAKKLINQGMITGTSAKAYQILISYDLTGISFEETSEYANLRDNQKLFYISSDRVANDEIPTVPTFIRTTGIQDDILDEIRKYVNFDDFKYLKPENFTFSKNPVYVDVSYVSSSDTINFSEILKNGQYISFENSILNNQGEFQVIREVEKMSKSKYNVVNPDAICEEYGADSLRLYEMFLGPLEQSKPWNTAGISGVHSFLKKLWKLYSPLEGGEGGVEPTAENLKTLHKTIKKVEEDIENFSFNTSVSTFMICVNELTAQKCTSRAILEPLAVLVSPYAPHIAEELWEKLGHSESISEANFPKFEEKYLVESSKEYPISFNGKMRFKLELPLDMGKDDIEAAVMAHEKTQAQLQGRTPKKVIVVPGKIVNIVG